MPQGAILDSRPIADSLIECVFALESQLPVLTLVCRLILSIYRMLDRSGFRP
jgi:hypothetical protein